MLNHFNHCGCHLELFLLGLKAQSTTPFCTGNVSSHRRLRLGCVVVCNDLSVAIAVKLVYLLFGKKRDFLFFFFVIVQAVARCICNREHSFFPLSESHNYPWKVYFRRRKEKHYCGTRSVLFLFFLRCFPKYHQTKSHFG